MKKIHLLLCCFLLSFCSRSQTQVTSLKTPGSSLEQSIVLEKDPLVPRPISNDEQIVFVVGGINDLHGTLFPTKETKEVQNPDGTMSSFSFTRGGAAILASFIKSLQQEYGEHFILLDAGDEFQGTLESNTAKKGPGAPMVQFLNKLGLVAAALGNHEFDFGQEVLRARMNEARYSFLAANVVDKGSNQASSLPKLAKRKMLTIGSVKIGIIGLSTKDTPTTTRPPLISNLSFTDLKEATLEQAHALREEKADLILLVAHVGLFCSTTKESKGLRLRSATDPQGNCRPQEELVELLASLPAGTVHGVVSGHTHQVIHHFVSQGGEPIPVIQGGHNSQYLNLIYFPYDRKQKKFLFQESKIEGPIPICEKVSEKNQDCTGENGELKAPNFHGKTIVPDGSVIQALTPLQKEILEQSQQVLGQAAQPLPAHGAAPLAALITRAMLEATGADLALINSGGIRSSLSAGPITYGDLFRVLPFDNKLCTLSVSGEELKNIIKVSQAKGQRPFPTAGITMEFLSDADAQNCQNASSALPTDPPIWKVHFWNEKSFQPQQSYKIALADFLIEGGSSLHSAITDQMRARKDCREEWLVRDIVKDYIKKQKEPINSTEHPLLNPNYSPRKFVKPPPGPLSCFSF